jgi:hypothetical protein
MTASVSSLFEKITIDSWRKEVGFTAEIETAHQMLFKEGVSEADCITILNSWIQRYQPCLFGRIAAKLSLISYCILTEVDLQQSDETIKRKIQSARLQWTKKGFEGEKSGFVISVISPKIAQGLPDENVKELAKRLGTLYLLTDVTSDEVYLDEIWLEKPGKGATTWEWNVGVNYFCAQGDKRWWQDHRIPGGMAFSMNSVGHMVKSGALADAMTQFNELMGTPEEGWITSKVNSLEAALEFAMRTIYGASDAVSGKATWLLPSPEDKNDLPVKECPVELPHFLQDKNFCSYEGYYHTDYTLPSEYFLPSVERPDDTKVHTLDFTYLFDKRLDNPDFDKLGSGRQVRGKPRPRKVVGRATKKRTRFSGKSVKISSKDRLVKALQAELTSLGYGPKALHELEQEASQISGGTTEIIEEATRKASSTFVNTAVHAYEISRITPWADISYKKVMVEGTGLGDVEHERILATLENYGLCLIRISGLSAESYVVEEVGRFIGPACERQNQFIGRIKELRPEPEGLINSGDTSKDLGLHVDGTQHEKQPDILIFQYVTEPQIGAHSVFVDAGKVLQDIEERKRHRILVDLARPDAAQFSKRDMVYTGPIFYVSNTGMSIKCRLRFDDVIKVNPEYQESFEYLRAAFNEEQYRTSFRPRDGDIIVFDNGRVLHARDQVYGPRVRIHRRMWISTLKPSLQSQFLLGVRPLPVQTLAAIKKANEG